MHTKTHAIANLAGEIAAGPLMADVKVKMEAQLRETYERFKTSRLMRDTLCT